jgi:hypothetical protein
MLFKSLSACIWCDNKRPAVIACIAWNLLLHKNSQNQSICHHVDGDFLLNKTSHKNVYFSTGVESLTMNPGKVVDLDQRDEKDPTKRLESSFVDRLGVCSVANAG